MNFRIIFAKGSVFILTLSLGILASGFLSFGKSVPHQCPRYAVSDPNTRFFTLEEGKSLIGKRVRWANESQFPNTSGRIAGLDLVVTDKFYVIVYWYNAPHTGGEGLRRYSKDDFERLVIDE